MHNNEAVFSDSYLELVVLSVVAGMKQNKKCCAKSGPSTTEKLKTLLSLMAGMLVAV